MELGCTLDISFLWGVTEGYGSGILEVRKFSKTSVYPKPMWNQRLWTLGGRKLSFLTGFCVDL